ncbi:MAG: NB-ARC domain-containing protein, partial [Elainellaceae cyanobacterium]
MTRDALVVGINRYQHEKLGNLTSPAADAEAIAQMLETKGNFLVQRLPEAITNGTAQIDPKGKVTRKQLMDAIAKLFKPDTENQIPRTALLYFSGHGWASNGYGYLAPTNGDPDEDLGVDFGWLRRSLESSKIQEQVVWLDCCNSGGLMSFDEVVSARQQISARYFITSSREFEASYQDLDSTYSVVTKTLLEGLDPDNSDTGRVTSADLTKHLDRRVKGQIQAPLCESKGGSILLTFGGSVKPDPPTSLLNQRLIPLQMPPLPDHFVERPDHQRAVKSHLLSTDPKTFGTLVVSAIHGLGGIGKSVLASKLAHDDDVQERFSDGVLCATLGQNPDLLPLQSGWIQALGDRDYKPTTVESTSAHLRTLLYDKKVLLVVDDVWNPEHLEPFRVGGSECCVMVTTREARILEAHRYDLDVMSPEQALALMTQKLSQPLSKEEQQRALAFAKEVGYLPLALELAATQIEEGVSWDELLEDFRDEVVRLESLDLYGPEEFPDDAKRRKYSLTACFNLSLKQLSAEQLRQFAWLGVVPEDVNLTQEMAMTLWQVTSRQAGAILRHFSAKALLLPGAEQQGNKRTYRLHDLMHDLAQKLLTSPPQPERQGGISGLGLTKAEAHSQLLKRYRSKTRNGQWYTLENDGYIYAYLTWHMEQAQRPDEIHQLLAVSNEAGRNGWYEACEAIAKPAGFVNDLGRAWRLAKDQFDTDPTTTLVRLFWYGLIRTSLNSLANNAPAELVAALVKAKIWQPAQGLAYAQQMQNPWDRSRCIAKLAPHISESLLPEVLAIANQINEPHDYALAIITLVKYFPKLLPTALEVTRQIQDESSLASALSELAKYVPEILPEALKTVQQIQDESNRASVLSALVSHLPSDLLPEVLEAIQQIQDESSRARALSALVAHLPSKLLPEALEVTRQIQRKSDRASALSALAEYLPERKPEPL